MEPETHVHWTDYISMLLVMFAILVGAWYLLIWLNPVSAINPFPPERIALQPEVVPAGGEPAGQGGGSSAFPPTWTPTPRGEPTATATRFPTWTPLPTSTPTPVPTRDPRWQFYVSGMRGQRYKGGEVSIYGTFGETPKYTTYLIFYTSESLRISGMMNVPKGRGSFPVIILCHGYIHPNKYATGNDTWREADYLAQRGYITIAPDYRSHAGSDNGTSFFHVGYAEDVLNLISSLHTVKKADQSRIGLWGHSMGGGVALKAAVVSKKVDAVAVFGSVSADERTNYYAGLGNGPGVLGIAWFGSPDNNRLGYKRVSSINYLDRIRALSIHHGTGDQIVPYKWSEELYAAAQDEQVPSELFLYKGGTHTLSGKDWDLAMERTLKFYDTYVKNGG